MEKEIKRIASVMLDDLKDAQMLYDYALEAQIEGHTNMADFYISLSKKRKEMLGEAHSKAKSLIKAKEEKDGQFADGKWDCLHEYYMKQSRELDYKISKFKM